MREAHVEAHQTSSTQRTETQRYVVADSGTNVNIVTSEFKLNNERASSTSPAIAADKGGIDFFSKGEHTVGDGLGVTTEKANVNEPLMGLGEFACNEHVSILDNSGMNITKKENVHIEHLQEPEITGTFDEDCLWRTPVQPPITQNPPVERPAGAVSYSACTQRTKKDLANFLHGSAGFPKLPTWM